MAKGIVKDVAFARGIEHLAPSINKIAREHNIPPADLTRGLLEAACQFFNENGWFSFPVTIQPKKFQAPSGIEDLKTPDEKDFLHNTPSAQWALFLAHYILRRTPTEELEIELKQRSKEPQDRWMANEEAISVAQNVGTSAQAHRAEESSGSGEGTPAHTSPKLGSKAKKPRGPRPEQR